MLSMSKVRSVSSLSKIAISPALNQLKEVLLMFIFDSRPPNPTPGIKSMRSGTHKTDAKNNSTRYTYILIFHRT